MRHEAITALRFDAASAINCGARDYQEDAILTEFALGNDLGFVVLADGMGGHAAGDVASKIAVTEVFRDITFQRDALARDPGLINAALKGAAQRANDGIAKHVIAQPETRGMGATLVIGMFTADALFWLSVGDSPLYLYRDGALTQINADHSMAEQIDMMVEKGMLSAAEGEGHPDRNMLTSALSGCPIPLIDCPEEPFGLQAGDMLIAASDGLQYLKDAQIEAILRERLLSRSSEIADALISEIDHLAHPQQDNVCLSVIQVKNAPQPFDKMRDVHLIRPDAFKPGLFASSPRNLAEEGAGMAKKRGLLGLKAGRQRLG